jgi:hypothetical protein
LLVEDFCYDLLLLRQVRDVVRLEGVDPPAWQGAIKAHHVDGNVVLLNDDARISNHAVCESTLSHSQIDQLLYVSLPHLGGWSAHILNVLIIEELVHHVLRSAVFRALLFKSPAATLLPLSGYGLILSRLG